MGIHHTSYLSPKLNTTATNMFLFLLLGSLALIGADKLDRTYLPPPGSKFAGGSPDAILPPIEYPKETSVTFNPTLEEGDQRDYFDQPSREPPRFRPASTQEVINPKSFDSTRIDNRVPSRRPTQRISTPVDVNQQRYTPTEAPTRFTTDLKLNDKYDKSETLHTRPGTVRVSEQKIFPTNQTSGRNQVTDQPSRDFHKPYIGAVKSTDASQPSILFTTQTPNFGNDKGINENFNIRPQLSQQTENRFQQTDLSTPSDIFQQPGLPTTEIPNIYGPDTNFAIQRNEFSPQVPTESVSYSESINQPGLSKSQSSVVSVSPSQFPNTFGIPTTTTSYAFSQTTTYSPIQEGCSGPDCVYDNSQPSFVDSGIEPHVSISHQGPDQTLTTLGSTISPLIGTNVQGVDNGNLKSQYPTYSSQFPATSQQISTVAPQYHSKFGKLDQQEKPNRPGQINKFHTIDDDFTRSSQTPKSLQSNIAYPNHLDNMILSSTPYPKISLLQSTTSPKDFSSTASSQIAIDKTGSDIHPGPGYKGVQNNSGRDSDLIDADRNAVILNYKNVITPEGEFSYSYDTSNGIHADESGTAHNGVKAQGSYSYIGDDGKLYSIIYSADENGYQPRGDHLPTPPPIPDAILRVIEAVNRDKANGEEDDGQYDEEKYGYKKYEVNNEHRRPQEIRDNNALGDFENSYNFTDTIDKTQGKVPISSYPRADYGGNENTGDNPQSPSISLIRSRLQPMNESPKIIQNEYGSNLGPHEHNLQKTDNEQYFEDNKNLSPDYDNTFTEQPNKRINTTEVIKPGRRPVKYQTSRVSTLGKYRPQQHDNRLSPNNIFDYNGQPVEQVDSQNFNMDTNMDSTRQPAINFNANRERIYQTSINPAKDRNQIPRVPIQNTLLQMNDIVSSDRDETVPGTNDEAIKSQGGLDYEHSDSQQNYNPISSKTYSEQRRPVSKQQTKFSDITVRPTRPTIRTGLDTNVQATSTRPIIVTKGEEETDGYQYLPPSHKFDQYSNKRPDLVRVTTKRPQISRNRTMTGQRVTTLRPFTTPGVSQASTEYDYDTEVDSQEYPIDNRNEEAGKGIKMDDSVRITSKRPTGKPYDSIKNRQQSYPRDQHFYDREEETEEGSPQSQYKPESTSSVGPTGQSFDDEAEAKVPYSRKDFNSIRKPSESIYRQRPGQNINREGTNALNPEARQNVHRHRPTPSPTSLTETKYPSSQDVKYVTKTPLLRHGDKSHPQPNINEYSSLPTTFKPSLGTSQTPSPGIRYNTQIPNTSNISRRPTTNKFTQTTPHSYNTVSDISSEVHPTSDYQITGRPRFEIQKQIPDNHDIPSLPKRPGILRTDIDRNQDVDNIQEVFPTDIEMTKKPQSGSTFKTIDGIPSRPGDSIRSRPQSYQFTAPEITRPSISGEDYQIAVTPSVINNRMQQQLLKNKNIDNAGSMERRPGVGFDEHGRPISTQNRVRGEDFSGPKQPASFDSETGYHY